jgi:hypothetical protein
MPEKETEARGSAAEKPGLEPKGLPGAEGPDTSALREELRRLGYLSNPLERFLVGDLGPAGSRRASPAWTNLVVSLKVGVLAGLLVGLLLLVAFLLSHPDLASSPRDVAVVTAYVLGLAAAALTAASLVVGGLMHVVFRLTRRAVPLVEQAATRAAVVVSVLVFLYLAFWWRRVHAAAGHGEPGWLDAAVVAGVLVVCVLLALALRAGGRALLLRLDYRSGGRAPASPPAGGRAPGPAETGRATKTPLWRWAVLAGFGAVTFFLIGYLRVYGTTVEPAAPVEFTTRYAGARLYLVAIDGMGYEEVREQFLTPKEGWLGGQAQVAPLDVPSAGNPATLWTTVATGLPPEKHGVEGFETTRVAGLDRYVPLRSGGPGFEDALAVVLPFLGFARRAPLSTSSLTARPLWELFSEKGVRVAVVNWWATWPAPDVRGVVVSDRTFAKLDLRQEKKAGDLAFEAETYPKAALDLVREVWQECEGTGQAAPATSSVGSRMDRFHEALTQALLAKQGQDPWPKQYEFVAVYLPGLDIAEHELLGPAQGLGSGQLGTVLEELRGMRRELNDWLSTLAREAEAHQATLLVVGTPSRRDRPSGAKGFYALGGRDVVPGLLPALGVYDLAPTILALMGFPVSSEMPGRAHLELFASPQVPTEVATLETYGPRPPGGSAPGSAFDQEYRQWLRGNGYIQ